MCTSESRGFEARVHGDFEFGCRVSTLHRDDSHGESVRDRSREVGVWPEEELECWTRVRAERETLLLRGNHHNGVLPWNTTVGWNEIRIMWGLGVGNRSFFILLVFIEVLLTVFKATSCLSLRWFFSLVRAIAFIFVSEIFSANERISFSLHEVAISIIGTTCRRVEPRKIIENWSKQEFSSLWRSTWCFKANYWFILRLGFIFQPVLIWKQKFLIKQVTARVSVYRMMVNWHLH